MTVRLGLVDSGLPAEQAVAAARSFTGGAVSVDHLGHGTAISQVICHHAPSVTLYNAQVFDGHGVTTARAVAEAIDWLIAEKVDLINLSLGLAQDRAILAAACGRAIEAGIIVIAASPARGAATYPASYPGVIRATGDARCAGDEISFLDSAQADFGGCPRGMDNDAGLQIGGASFGAAHISGQAAAYLLKGGDKNSVRDWLVSRAKYIHNERRTK